MIENVIVAITAALLAIFPPMDNEAHLFAEEVLSAEALIAVNEFYLDQIGEDRTELEAYLADLTTKLARVQRDILDLGRSFDGLGEYACDQYIQLFWSLSEFGAFANGFTDTDRDQVSEITATIIDERIHADGGFAVRDSNAFEQLITESQEQLEILYETRARLTRLHAEVRELVTVILSIGCVEPGLLGM